MIDMKTQNFDIIGKLRLEFGEYSIEIAGEEGVATCAILIFDESAKENSRFITECFEIEHGIVSRTVMDLPPVTAYKFMDLFSAMSRRDKKIIEWKFANG